MQQRAHFTQKLEDLKMQMLRMASLAEKAVNDAAAAFLQYDADMAEKVIMGDVEINEMECAIDRANLEMLAMDQPVARDLRFIIGSMRMSVNLERMGDEAVNLAHRALFLSSRPPLPYNQKVERLAELCARMFQMALKAFVDADVALANEVCDLDDEADELSLRVLKEYINGMVSESRLVERSVHTIMAARHMERIADQATNIAEIVIFIVEGEDVKHKCRG